MCCSSQPDVSGINKAAEANANIARDALQWYQKAYADQAPLREQAAATAQKVSDAQLAAMGTATDIARKDQAYRENVFQPLETSLVKDAQNFDTEAERERLAGLAGADTAQAFGSARDTMARQLASAGVDPSDGAYVSGLSKLNAQQALATAYGKNKARSDATTLGRALKYDAAALGRGLASSSATQAGLSINAGNAAAANGITPVTLAQQGTSMVGQGFDAAMRGNSSAGNLYGQAAQIQNQANQQGDAIWGALGQAGGAAIMKWSDKNMKEDITPASGSEALDAVEHTPVKSWRYKPGSPGDDGGQKHTGPTAQDANRTMGDAVAPRGRMIDLISANGITMAAVKELSKKVDRLAAKSGVQV